MNINIQPSLQAAESKANRMGGKVVTLTMIADYMGADTEKVRIALRHLAAARAAIELCTGEWVLVSSMPTPRVQRGKLLVMTRRGKK